MSTATELEFAGVSSGSNNYAPTNEALTERVENDMEKFLERNPEVKAEDTPTDLLNSFRDRVLTLTYRLNPHRYKFHV